MFTIFMIILIVAIFACGIILLLKHKIDSYSLSGYLAIVLLLASAMVDLFGWFWVSEQIPFDALFFLRQEDIIFSWIFGAPVWGPFFLWSIYNRINQTAVSNRYLNSERKIRLDR